MFKIFYAFCLCVLGQIAMAQDLPRFAALKSNEINLRTGPGERFPIDWVYTQANLPVEIIDEFEHWRKIRDIDDTVGWVHKKMLSGKRTAFTPKDAETVIYKKADKNSAPLVFIHGRVIIFLEECDKDSVFCRVSFQGVTGYVIKNALWGLYKGEDI